MGLNREPRPWRVRWRAASPTRAVLATIAALVAVVIGATSGQAQESDGELDRLIAEGRVVYEANCIGCHQADGMGTPGVFPPLVGNERIDEEGYVARIVSQGLQGEIEVNGVTYDGVMPAFTALSEQEVAALTVYVQEGLGLPAPPPPADTGDEGAVAGTELPFGVVLTYGLGFLVFAAAAIFVLGPVVLTKRVEGEFTAPQVYLKSGLIVLYFIVATVVIPSMIIESGLLAEPPSVYQDLFSADTWGTVRDLIGTGVWFGALGIGIWMLRRLQRNRVI